MKEFKEGDEVILKGKVVKVNDENSMYPISCLFNATTLSFTKDGSHYKGKEPSLYHDYTVNIERVVQVRDFDRENWVQRVLIKETTAEFGKYVCWASAKTIEESIEATKTEGWNQMKEIPKKKQISIEEIAKKFKCSAEEIEITYSN